MLTTRKPVSYLGGITILTITALAIIGWIMNIVALFHMSDGPITGEMVLRAIGVIVAPLGAILGFV